MIHWLLRPSYATLVAQASGGIEECLAANPNGTDTWSVAARELN